MSHYSYSTISSSSLTTVSSQFDNERQNQMTDEWPDPPIETNQTIIHDNWRFEKNISLKDQQLNNNTCILKAIMTKEQILICDSSSTRSTIIPGKHVSMKIGIFCFFATQWLNALPISKTTEHLTALTSCELCNILLPIAKGFIASNESSLIEELGIVLCQYLHLADDAVCAGMINEYHYVLIEVLRHSPLSTYEICGVAFECMRQADIPALKWNVTLPPPIKALVLSSRLSNERSSSISILSILHLADLHIDREYKPGSNANCGRPLCCRDGTPKIDEKGAGFWGDYRTCDIPQWTVESILKYIVQNEEQIDLIYFTGDIAPHDVWQQTEDKDLEEISFTTRLLKQTFPNKKIYPCVGNHEAAPPDLFRTDDMSWLYLNLANQWINQFGLDEQTKDTILKGGYYTTIIAPKIRLISLNMNYCTENNYWLFINSTDPLGQLQWLIQWLQYAEDLQEKVHIIGHHPPRMCMVSFSWAYYSIVNRYQNTITGQFFAHTHNDEFMLFYNETDSKQPISIAYITPSFTTYPNLNPAYRFYMIDAENSASVLDHRTVILNLTSTNLYNTTKFMNEYSAKLTYDMKDLSPQEWNNFVLRLENNIDGETMGLVYQFFMKSSVTGKACDRTCRMKLINCNLKIARAQDTTFCFEDS